MKQTIALTICLGLATALAVEAKPHDKAEKKAQHQQKKAAQAVAKAERHQYHGGGNHGQFQHQTNDFRPQVAAQRNVQQQVQSNVTNEVRRSSGVAIQRRGPSNYSWSYDEARRHFNRGVRHDRSWYQSNYNRFALFGGGYYYFDRGYWYPAYGYDTAYSTYRFDEPIYGYNSLEPGQVLVNVQQELRRQGYYRGEIDGLIGPMTRAALARYQADRGLYVTRAVDGPTLAALGLT